MNKDIKPIWQQKEQLNGGGTTRERIARYVSLWEARCYSEGIPDEIPALLEKTGRAPSYKSIAICILKNDLKLNGLGFNKESESWADNMYWDKRRLNYNKECGQIDIFD